MARRILVIGGLAAGPSAASKAKRVNPAAEVVLFEQGSDVSYGICEIPYFIAGEVDGSKLVVNTPDQLRQKKQIEVRAQHRVEEILPTQRKIIVRDFKQGRTFEEPYDKLIIATGSSPRQLGIEGEESRNVFSVSSLEDGHRIHRYIEAEKPSHAVIIGGGYIGMEMCECLRAREIGVTLLHNQSLPMKGLERAAQEDVRSELERKGVQFVAHARTQGFVADRARRVTQVVTDQGTFEADIVIVAIGVKPNSALAAAAGVTLGTAGGILTDQRQQTNIDNVFAAGDCCETRNVATNKFMYIPLATIASKQGWVAGENAAGGSALFKGAVRAVGVRVFDLEVARVGLSAAEAESCGFRPVTETISALSRVGMMPGSKRLNVTLIADKSSRRLLGANLWGGEGAVLRSNICATLIQHKITIDDMQQLDLVYSPPFSPLWDPLLVAANTVRKKL